ncbi:MAG: TonB-dependent receptor plug domain-containing protein [Rhodomicrobium sp.]|nr:TonB-dependent receptor plug domain-containing protein [Rhodomicrobium sp.]
MRPNRHAIQRLLLSSSALVAAVAWADVATAQDDDASDGDIIIVTGTRITSPNVTAASPINTIGQDEIARQFTPERRARVPGSADHDPGRRSEREQRHGRRRVGRPSRLGAERSLIMIDGKRLVPYNYDGIVDINTIPLQMLERVDIITGGARRSTARTRCRARSTSSFAMTSRARSSRVPTR